MNSTPRRDTLLLGLQPLHEVVAGQDIVERYIGEQGFALVLDIAVVEGSSKAGNAAAASVTLE